MFKLFPSVQAVPLYSSESALLADPVHPPATNPAVKVPEPVVNLSAPAKFPPTAQPDPLYS